MNIRDVMEELKDIPRTNRIYHRTNIYSLEQILKSGKLKSTCYGDRSKNSICFGRKSVFSKIDSGKLASDNLSNNIGLVEFIIFEDRLGNNKLRGVKKEKISEFSTESLEYIKNVIQKAYPDAKVNPIIKDIKKLASSEINRMLSSDEGYSLSSKDIPSKITNKYTNLTERELFLIIVHLVRAIKYTTKSRESEERLTKKNEDFYIPLDKNLMIIKLLPGACDKILRIKSKKPYGVNKDFPTPASEHDKNQINRLLELIKDNSSVFLKNNEFKKCIKALNESNKE